MDEKTFAATYPRLAHAMQSGVAATIALNEQVAIPGSRGDHTPKHLRVGVNMAMAEHSALSKLLCDKGVITEDEYRQALVDGLTREVAKYEKELSEKYGRPVTLA
jgi:hypothetical protein